MILKKIEYFEGKNSIFEWSLNEFILEKVNLLVGKNATGKSRTIQTISNIGQLLRDGIPFVYPSSAYCSIELSDVSDLYQYILEKANNKVINECLKVNHETLLTRGKNGIGKIFARKENRMIDFQVDDNLSVIALRQDAIQHPYLKKIVDWADGLRIYEFGGTLGKNTGIPLGSDDDTTINLHASNQAVWFYKKGEKEFGNNFERLILENMNMLDYHLRKIWIQPYSSFSREMVQAICVFEKDREDLLPQSKMSQGMFRALSLIIQVTYNILKKASLTILIDDIGEGLDFDRSTKLISLLIDIAENNDIQLIMSTNDEFVMNKVPLKYWQVIQRKGGVCTIRNMRNSKADFEEYQYTGLSNFDILTTDFFNRETQSK